MSTAADAARELVAAGDPHGALELLQQQVREHADDARLRVFLFQLLCVLGRWQRAAAQLQVCGELDAAALAMVATYRDAVGCEPVREAVFAGQATPVVFGEGAAWTAALIEALQADARGDADDAARLRAEALDAAPATAGSLDGEAFDWIADADSRLGPVLEAVVGGRYGWMPFAALRSITVEAPTDLRDLVWAPARLELAAGGDAMALLPVRYAGSHAAGDGALCLARRTEWLALAAGQYRGLGQRMLATSGPEVGLLDVREIVLHAAAPAAGPAR